MLLGVPELLVVGVDGLMGAFQMMCEILEK